MTGEGQHDLELLDRALIRLRRYFENPTVLDDDGSPVDLSTLLVLDALTSAGRAATVHDIARRLDVAHSTASRFVTRAERAGLVARAPSAKDLRVTLVEPTDTGRGLATRAARFRIARLAHITHTWDPADTAALAQLLNRFAADNSTEALTANDPEAS